MTAKQTGVRGKVREGTVVSDKMQKTIVVAIESNFRHRLYKKTVRRIRRFMVHDETENAKLGDRVRIVETSPVSRRKRWRLLDVLVKAELPEVAPESIDLELLGEVKPEEAEVEEAAREAAAKAEEPVPAEAVSSPEAEAVVPEEVEVAEEVPDIEPAVEEEAPQEAESEPEAFVEPEAEPVEAQAEAEQEAPPGEETPDEEKPS
jgi:small subunit ribosomal protein S17